MRDFKSPSSPEWIFRADPQDAKGLHVHLRCLGLELGPSSGTRMAGPVSGSEIPTTAVSDFNPKIDGAAPFGSSSRPPPSF